MIGSKNRYQTMIASAQTNSLGQQYPDVTTFPINKFKYNNSQLQATLTQMDIQRFDLFIFSYYNTPDYTDIVLWLNNVAFLNDLNPGDTILLPDIDDINAFYLEFK